MYGVQSLDPCLYSVLINMLEVIIIMITRFGIRCKARHEGEARKFIKLPSPITPHFSKGRSEKTDSESTDVRYCILLTRRRNVIITHWPVHVAQLEGQEHHHKHEVKSSFSIDLFFKITHEPILLEICHIFNNSRVSNCEK